MLVSAAIGALFTLMMLTKTTAVFLLPSIGWALLAPLWPKRKLAVRSAAAAAGAFVATFGLWMAMVIHAGLLRDYEYLFVVNKYPKPAEFCWPLLSLWWSFHGGLWVDRILIPLAGLVPVCAVLAWRSGWSRRLVRDPAFVASLLAVAGYIGFMTYQNHPQPRYYAVVAFFAFFVLAMGIEALLSAAWGNGLGGRGGQAEAVTGGEPKPSPAWGRNGTAALGLVLMGGAAVAVCLNGEWTAGLAMRPEYTLVPAAQKLTSYIDQHPNGKRLLLSISGDEISMITHLPAICDDFGTQDLVSKLRDYEPGWFATWNDLDPGTLEDIHSRYSLEQLATFHALDHPDRNMLVLFKLHPLPNGQVRDPEVQNLQVALPEDKIDIPIE